MLIGENVNLCENFACYVKIVYLPGKLRVKTMQFPPAIFQLYSIMSVCVCWYVCVLCVCQMIRKSVETRDWLHTLEPRSVRSVMKRVVEEVTLLDKQVSTLYEDGTKKEQGSGIAWLLPLLCLFALGSVLMYV